MTGRIGLVLNPTAGPPDESWSSARLAGLFAAGVQPQILSGATGREIYRATRTLIESGCSLIAAAGGDGTVSGVASALIDSPASLGVLPIGTLNHFARDLGIPLAPVRAAELLVSGRSRAIDVAEVNGCRFINNSSLGLYPGIVRRRERWEKKGMHRLVAFAAASLMMFRRYPFLDVTVRIGGAEYKRRSPFVFVGNNLYEMEGARLGRRARLDEGLLSLVAANRMTRLGLLRIASSALFHHLRSRRDFELLSARELLIETRRKHMHVALDGEVMRLHPPLRYRILPGALRVIVP